MVVQDHNELNASFPGLPVLILAVPTASLHQCGGPGLEIERNFRKMVAAHSPALALVQSGARAKQTTNQKERTMQIKLNPVGPNQTEIEKPDGTTVLFSYKTPVAVFVPGRGALCTKTHYSKTTSRHVNAAVERWGATRHDVEQSEIDALAS